MMNNLSDYELVRLNNIKKNEEFMRSLELNSVKQKLNVQQVNTDLAVKKRKCTKAGDVKLFPTRRSVRGQVTTVDIGNKAYVDEEVGDKEDDDDYDSIKKPRSSTERMNYEHNDSERVSIDATLLRNLIEETNIVHYESISDKQIEHCAYRVGYMSSRALATRLNMIGRHASKKSFEKLLVFYYALKAAQLLHLAEIAHDILVDIGVV